MPAKPNPGMGERSAGRSGEGAPPMTNRVSFAISDHQLVALDYLSAQRGVTISGLIRDLISRELQGEGLHETGLAAPTGKDEHVAGKAVRFFKLFNRFPPGLTDDQLDAAKSLLTQSPRPDQPHEKQLPSDTRSKPPGAATVRHRKGIKEAEPA
jgi:hypothetical protein